MITISFGIFLWLLSKSGLVWASCEWVVLLTLVLDFVVLLIFIPQN